MYVGALLPSVVRMHTCVHGVCLQCLEAFEGFNIYEVHLCPVCRQDYKSVDPSRHHHRSGSSTAAALA